MIRFITWLCAGMVPVGLIIFGLQGDWVLGIVAAGAYGMAFYLGRVLMQNRRLLEENAERHTRNAERLDEIERRGGDRTGGGS